MDVLECIHSLLSAGILSLFCLLCYLIHKCCCNVAPYGDYKKTCHCDIHEITGQITPSNNIIVSRPDDVPIKQPIYEFLSKGTASKLPMPSDSCEHCCETPCFSDMDTISSEGSETSMDDYAYSESSPKDRFRDDMRYPTRDQEYTTNVVMLENPNTLSRNKSRSYSHLDDRSSTRRSSSPCSEHPSSTKHSSRSAYSEHPSSTRRSSRSPHSEYPSSIKRSSRSPYSEHPSSTKRSSRSLYLEKSSTKLSSHNDYRYYNKRLPDDTLNISSENYFRSSKHDTDTYAVQEDPRAMRTNRSLQGKKPHSSQLSSLKKRKVYSSQSSEMTGSNTTKSSRKSERDKEPEEEEHCLTVKVCMKGANSISNMYNDKHYKETPSGTKISIVGPSYVRQNMSGEKGFGESGATGPSEPKGRCSDSCAYRTGEANLTLAPNNFGQFNPAYKNFTAPLQAYCVPKVIVHMDSSGQQQQNYSGQDYTCQNIFGQLARNACKCLPDNDDFMGNMKRTISRLCCNCGCHKMKTNNSGRAYNGQIKNTEVVDNNGTVENKIKQNTSDQPNERRSSTQQTSTQKSFNKSGDTNNEDVIDEIKIKRIDCCCGKSCPLNVTAPKKFRNVDGKNPPVAGGAYELQTSGSRPNSQGAADSYPEIDSGRGSSQRGANEDCLTRLTDLSITRLYEKYGCDSTCSQSSSNHEVYTDPLSRLTKKYGASGSKQGDSGLATLTDTSDRPGNESSHSFYCDCVYCKDEACFLPRDKVQGILSKNIPAKSWFALECSCEEDEDEEDNIPAAKKFASAPDKLGDNIECAKHTEPCNRALDDPCDKECPNPQQNKSNKLKTPTGYSAWSRFTDLFNFDCTCDEEDDEEFLEALGQSLEAVIKISDGKRGPEELNESDEMLAYEDCQPECPNLGSIKSVESRKREKSFRKKEEREGRNKSDKSWFALECSCEEDEEENIPATEKFSSTRDKLGDNRKCANQKEPCYRTADDPCDLDCLNRQNVGGKLGFPTWSMLTDLFDLECTCDDDDDILIFSGTKSDKSSAREQDFKTQEDFGRPVTEREEYNECDPKCSYFSSISSAKQSERQREYPEESSRRKGKRHPSRKRSRERSPGGSLRRKEERGGSPVVNPRDSFGEKDGRALSPKEGRTYTGGSAESRERQVGSREGSSGRKSGRAGSPPQKEKRGGSPAVTPGGKGEQEKSPRGTFSEKEKRPRSPRRREQKRSRVVAEDKCDPECPQTPKKGYKGGRGRKTRDSRNEKGGEERNSGYIEGRGEDKGLGAVREDEKCDTECPNSSNNEFERGQSGNTRDSSSGKGKRARSPGDLEGLGEQKRPVGGDDDCNPECPNSPERGQNRSPKDTPSEKAGRSRNTGDFEGRGIQKSPGAVGGDDECDTECPNSPEGGQEGSPRINSNEKGGRARSPGALGGDGECDPECLNSSNQEPVRRSRGQNGFERKGQTTGDDCFSTCPNSSNKEEQGTHKKYRTIDDECDPNCLDSLRTGSPGRSGGTNGSPNRSAGDKDCDPQCPSSSSAGYPVRSGGTNGSPMRIKEDKDCDPICPGTSSTGSPGRSEGTNGSTRRTGGDNDCDPQCPISSTAGSPGRSGGTNGSHGRIKEDKDCDPICPGTSGTGSPGRSEGTRGSTRRTGGDNDCDPQCPISSTTGSPGRYGGTNGSPRRINGDKDCDPICPVTSSTGSPGRSEGTNGSTRRTGGDNDCDPQCPISSTAGSPGRYGGTNGSPGRIKGDKDCDPICLGTSSTGSPRRFDGKSESPRRIGGEKDCEPKCPSSSNTGSPVHSAGTNGSPRRIEGDDECDPKCPDSLRPGSPVRSTGTSGGARRTGGDGECDPKCLDSLKPGSPRQYERSPKRVGEEKDCEPKCPSSSNTGSPVRSAGTNGSPRSIGGDSECDPKCPDSLRPGSPVRFAGTNGSARRTGGDDECDPKCPDSLRPGFPRQYEGTSGSPKRIGEERDCEPKCPSSVSTEPGRPKAIRNFEGRVGPEKYGPEEGCEPVCPALNKPDPSRGYPAEKFKPGSPTNSGKSGCKSSPCTPDVVSTKNSRTPGKRSPSTPGSRSPGRSKRSSQSGSKSRSPPKSPDDFIYGKKRPDSGTKTSSKEGRSSPSQGKSEKYTPTEGGFRYITPCKSNNRSSASSSQTQFTDLLLADNDDDNEKLYSQSALSSGKCSTTCSAIDSMKSTPGTSKANVSKRNLNKDFDNEVPRKRMKGDYSSTKGKNDSSRCAICCKYLTENNSAREPRDKCSECCQAIRERMNKNKFGQQKQFESSDRVWPSKSKSTNSVRQNESTRLARVRARSTGPSSNIQTYSVSSKIEIMSNSKSSINKLNLDKINVKPLVRIRIKKSGQEGEQSNSGSLSIFKSIANAIEDVCSCSDEIDAAKSRQSPNNVTEMLTQLRKDPNVAWSEVSNNPGTTTDALTIDKYHISLEETKKMCPMLSESGDIKDNIPERKSLQDPQYGKFFPYKPSPCKLLPCPYSDDPLSPDFPCSRPCPCRKHYCYPVPPKYDSFVRLYHQVPENFPAVCDDRQSTGICCEQMVKQRKKKATGSCNPQCFDPSDVSSKQKD